jgi:hypothetical protein
LDEIDHVAADTAAATIEDLLFSVDREAIVPAAFRTGTDMLNADAPKRDTATRELAFAVQLSNASMMFSL